MKTIKCSDQLYQRIMDSIFGDTWKGEVFTVETFDFKIPEETIDVFDSSRRCAKCGGIDIYNRFTKEGERLSLNIGDIKTADRDIVTRRCRCCSYEWQELPIDSPEGKELLLKMAKEAAENYQNYVKAMMD